MKKPNLLIALACLVVTGVPALAASWRPFKVTGTLHFVSDKHVKSNGDGDYVVRGPVTSSGLASARAVAPPDAAVTSSRDVALEAALLRDSDSARALVRRELGPLGEGERGERLRATLRAVFATGNGASAAAAMGVSPRTVTNRIAEIEERLGCAPHTRRTELDVALRLERLLDGDE